MKILEYRPNFGTLSAGFESFFKNEVVDVLKLDKNAMYGYNRIHKQWFPSSYSTISGYEPEKSIDLAIFKPDFGDHVAKKGKSNFFFYDFQACLSFLEANLPDFAIFQTEVDVIPLVNNAPEYVRDGFGQLSKDRIIYSLNQMGYESYLVVIDEADYGIPLHRSFAFYIATPQGFDLRLPKPLFTATGRGSYSKFRTIADAIGDLDVMGDWVEYRCEPQNSYQRLLREEEVPKVTWHHPPNIKETMKKKISSIKQGSNNDTIHAKTRSKGYNRAKWNEICRSMDPKFYLVSSKLGDSIHPLQNRPFSIREGCRIHGLPDRLSFDMKVPNNILAKMIHSSVAPAIGEILALALRSEIS